MRTAIDSINMNLAKIFQAIEETRFLKTLSLQENLLFVGKLEPLKYIRDFFADCKQADSNFYYDLSSFYLDDICSFLANNNRYQAVIIVSLEDEMSLFSQVGHQLSNFELEIPVIRLFADVFINLMCHRDLLQLTSDDPIEPKISYAVLTTPRSGSTYFCDLLSSTGIAGYPIEHLRLANEELALNCDFDYFRLLSNLMQYRVSDNEVFGTKVISHFLFELRRTKPKFRRIFKLIDQYILLVRKDKVAQAVSLVLAQKTAVWHIQKNNSQDIGDRTYRSALENIVIDDELLLEVKKKHQFIENQENRLRNMLDVNRIEALEIIYEDIVENAELEVNKVLNFLKIPQSSHQATNISSQIKKMPCDISQEIIRQYKQVKSF